MSCQTRLCVGWFSRQVWSRVMSTSSVRGSLRTVPGLALSSRASRSERVPWRRVARRTRDPRSRSREARAAPGRRPRTRRSPDGRTPPRYSRNPHGDGSASTTRRSMRGWRRPQRCRTPAAQGTSRPQHRSATSGPASLRMAHTANTSFEPEAFQAGGDSRGTGARPHRSTSCDPSGDPR